MHTYNISMLKMTLVIILFPHFLGSALNKLPALKSLLQDLLFREFKLRRCQKSITD